MARPKPRPVPGARAPQAEVTRRDQRVEQFIERMGLSAQGDGLPRIAGRMMAWFVLNGGPISLQDLSEALSISKASASTNARLLVGLGVLERSATQGRRDYYELADDGYARLLEGYIDRMRERVRMIDDLTPAIAGARRDVGDRVGQMRSFYAQAIESTENLVERLRRQRR